MLGPPPPIDEDRGGYDADVSEPFRFIFRVRYAECDPQQIVFNARWGDYVDIAATE